MATVPGPGRNMADENLTTPLFNGDDPAAPVRGASGSGGDPVGYPGGQTGGYPGGAPARGYGEELDLRGYVQILWEYRQWIIGVTLAATLAGFLYAFLAPRKYTATATVFIDRGMQKGPKDVSNVASTDLTTEMFFNSQVEIIRSKEVLGNAVQALGLETNPAFQGKNAVAALRKMTTVQRKRDSALFTIAVTSTQKEEVAAWANGIAEAYDRVTLHQKLQYLQEADRLMGEQAGKMEKEYGRLRQAYGEHLEKTGSYFPENQQLITDSRIQGLELKRNDVVMQKNEVSARLNQLRGIQNDKVDPLSLAFVQANPAMQDLLQQYNQAEKDLAKMSTQLTPKHPSIVKKNEEIAGIRRRIRNQGILLLQAQESQAAALNQEYGALTAELASLKQQAIEGTQRSSQSESLQSGVESVRKYMDLLVEKMREVDVAASLMSNQIRIVDRAETPGSASKPNRKMVLLLSFMLGFMGSVGSVLLVRALDTRLKDPEDIERKLGVPLIGTIPVHTGETRPIVVEAFQTLRTSLIYCSDHKAKNVLMVTSATSGEGKSTVVTNLGITLASTGDKVLLIDCDARKSTLHKFFGIKPKEGLSEFLASEGGDASPYILPAGRPNLSLMPAGKLPANPPNLYSMDKFHRLLQGAKGDYDWVILDTPPVLAVTDASIIAGEVDLALLVGRFKFSQIPLMEQVLAQFNRIGRPVCGVVLNHFEYGRHYYYRGDYYRHYHYYYGKEPPETTWDKVIRTFTRRKSKKPSPRRATV